MRQAAMTSRRNPLDFAYESLVETSRQENLSSPLFSGVLGAAHGRPKAVRKHASRARAVNQRSAEPENFPRRYTFHSIRLHPTCCARLEMKGREILRISLRMTIIVFQPAGEKYRLNRHVILDESLLPPAGVLVKV